MSGGIKPMKNKKLVSIFSILLILILTIPGFAQGVVNVIIHNVESVPLENEAGYEISTYVSLYDASGEVVDNATADIFTIYENSQKMEIQSIAPALDVPVNIVLVLDTSGSMEGKSIDEAKLAAQNVVKSMTSEDKVALITFDDQPQTIFNFTGDTSNAVNTITSVKAKHNGGTCLYDAMYEAIQLVSDLPSGQRFIVVLSDGYDQTLAGTACSYYTSEDIQGFSSTGYSSVPIFNIGLGNNVDTDGLKMISNISGGKYYNAESTSDLNNIFADVFTQLKTQYLIKYISTQPYGEHTLTINASHFSGSDQDEYTFTSPKATSLLTITSPLDKSTISNDFDLQIDATNRGIPITKLTVYVNDTPVVAFSETPYETEINLKDYDIDADELEIKAVAEYSNQESTNQISIDVNLKKSILSLPSSATATPVPSATDLPSSNTTPTTSAWYMLIPSLPAWANISIIAAILLILILVIVFLILKSKNKEEDSSYNSDNEMTMDGFDIGALLSGEFNASLKVEASDDQLIIGQNISITKSIFTLGRSSQNDLSFPKDTPVSRNHAIIEESNGIFTLKESVSTTSSGATKTPTYGTFVNGKKLSNPTTLSNGDEIQLGPRVKLTFISTSNAKTNFGSEDETFDGIDTSELGLDEDVTTIL